MVLRHSRWLRCCYRRRHARRCAFAFWQQRERDMNDEKGRPMTYWGGKPAPESSEQQIFPECGAGPDTQCDLRFLAANCPRNMRSEEKQERDSPTWDEVDAIRKGKSDIDLAERIWKLERELADTADRLEVCGKMLEGALAAADNRSADKGKG